MNNEDSEKRNDNAVEDFDDRHAGVALEDGVVEWDGDALDVVDTAADIHMNADAQSIGK